MGNVIRNVLAVGITVGLLAVPFAIVRASYEVAFVGAAPEIEQLRSDMAKIPGAAPDEVLGQATEWNQTIRRMQAYNSTWWGDPFIPDAWEGVAPLSVSGPVCPLPTPPVG